MNRLLDRSNNLAILTARILSTIIGIGVARFVFTGLIPLMFEDYSSIKFVGILASLSFAGYLTGSILSVSLEDINQEMLFYRMGVVLAMATTSVLGFSINSTFRAISRVLGGLAGAMALVVGSATVVTKLRVESKMKAMGIHFSSTGSSISTTNLIARYALSLGYIW